MVAGTYARDALVGLWLYGSGPALSGKIQHENIYCSAPHPNSPKPIKMNALGTSCIQLGQVAVFIPADAVGAGKLTAQPVAATLLHDLAAGMKTKTDRILEAERRAHRHLMVTRPRITAEC